MLLESNISIEPHTKPNIKPMESNHKVKFSETPPFLDTEFGKYIESNIKSDNVKGLHDELRDLLVQKQNSGKTNISLAFEKGHLNINDLKDVLEYVCRKLYNADQDESAGPYKAELIVSITGEFINKYDHKEVEKAFNVLPVTIYLFFKQKYKQDIYNRIFYSYNEEDEFKINPSNSRKGSFTQDQVTQIIEKMDINNIEADNAIHLGEIISKHFDLNLNPNLYHAFGTILSGQAMMNSSFIEFPFNKDYSNKSSELQLDTLLQLLNNVNTSYGNNNETESIKQLITAKIEGFNNSKYEEDFDTASSFLNYAKDMGVIPKNNGEHKVVLCKENNKEINIDTEIQQQDECIYDAMMELVAIKNDSNHKVGVVHTVRINNSFYNGDGDFLDGEFHLRNEQYRPLKEKYDKCIDIESKERQRLLISQSKEETDKAQGGLTAVNSKALSDYMKIERPKIWLDGLGIQENQQQAEMNKLIQNYRQLEMMLEFSYRIEDESDIDTIKKSDVISFPIQTGGITSGHYMLGILDIRNNKLHVINSLQSSSEVSEYKNDENNCQIQSYNQSLISNELTKFISEINKYHSPNEKINKNNLTVEYKVGKRQHFDAGCGPANLINFGDYLSNPDTLNKMSFKTPNKISLEEELVARYIIGKNSQI